jgi:hypothetical protein
VDSAAVTLVESDMIATAAQTTVTQTSATWGLDRIDQLALPLTGTYAYSTMASDVTAYIIDTGAGALCLCCLVTAQSGVESGPSGLC